MARRKRKDEAPDWTPPEFDEVTYMRREIESAQVALVTIGWAAVGAIIAWLLYAYVHPVVGFLVGLAAFALLYLLLPSLGLPTDKFKARDWMGHASIYFFSWLAFFIIILNPPFGDHTPPTIQFVAAGTYATSTNGDPPVGNLYCVPLSAGATVAATSQSGNNTLYVLFRATDNVGISQVNVTVTPGTGSVQLVEGLESACSSSPAGTVYQPGTYAVKIPITTGSFTIQVTARDSANPPATASATVLV